jgi:hypothetical protein
MDMITVLVDDMTVASSDSLLLPEGPKARDWNSKELTEPGLPILLRDDRARLTKKEARGMSNRAVRELFLLRVLAVLVLIICHVMLKDGMTGSVLLRQGCGID